MNWIKDFIPTIKRNISQTFGEEKTAKYRKGCGDLVIHVALFSIFQNLKKTLMSAQNALIILK